MKRSPRHGAILIEFALVLGVFFLLFAGGIQVGILAEKKQLAELAAEYAARMKARASDDADAAILARCREVFFDESDTIAISYTVEDGVIAATVRCECARLFAGTPGLMAVTATFKE